MKKGVKKFNFDVPTQTLTVSYDANKTNPDKLRAAISKIGYDADEVPANPKAYAKLPSCCKKPETGHNGKCCSDHGHS